MKFPGVLSLVLLLVSFARLHETCNAQKMIAPSPIDPTILRIGGSAFVDSAVGIEFDVPLGYSLRHVRKPPIYRFYSDSLSRFVLVCQIRNMDDYGLRRTHEIDSADLMKGYSLSIAENETALDKEDGTKFLDIDTLIESRNPFGARTLEIRQILDKSTCKDCYRATLWAVDVSMPSGTRIALIMTMGRQTPLTMNLARQISRSLHQIELR